MTVDVVDVGTVALAQVIVGRPVARRIGQLVVHVPAPRADDDMVFLRCQRSGKIRPAMLKVASVKVVLVC